jgi:hypothetical protein
MRMPTTKLIRLALRQARRAASVSVDPFERQEWAELVRGLCDIRRRTVLATHRRAYGRPVAPASCLDYANIVLGKASGCTDAELASEVGMTRTALYQRLRTLARAGDEHTCARCNVL